MVLVNEDLELIGIGRSEVLTVVLVMIQVFWDVTLSGTD
jgi:hypothetical protein